MLQLRVQVQDGGTPPRSASTVVQVNVIRNLFAPQFFANGIIKTSIPETATPGYSVFQVTATDADATVSWISFVDGVSPCFVQITNL